VPGISVVLLEAWRLCLARSRTQYIHADRLAHLTAIVQVSDNDSHRRRQVIMTRIQWLSSPPIPDLSHRMFTSPRAVAIPGLLRHNNRSYERMLECKGTR
jgi:hypothetical protein